jgi:hypothetical protein
MFFLVKGASTHTSQNGFPLFLYLHWKSGCTLFRRNKKVSEINLRPLPLFSSEPASKTKDFTHARPARPGNSALPHGKRCLTVVTAPADSWVPPYDPVGAECFSTLQCSPQYCLAPSFSVPAAATARCPRALGSKKSVSRLLSPEKRSHVLRERELRRRCEGQRAGGDSWM